MVDISTVQWGAWNGNKPMKPSQAQAAALPKLLLARASTPSGIEFIAENKVMAGNQWKFGGSPTLRFSPQFFWQEAAIEEVAGVPVEKLLERCSLNMSTSCWIMEQQTCQSVLVLKRVVATRRMWLQLETFQRWLAWWWVVEFSAIAKLWCKILAYPIPQTHLPFVSDGQQFPLNWMSPTKTACQIPSYACARTSSHALFLSRNQIKSNYRTVSNGDHSHGCWPCAVHDADRKRSAPLLQVVRILSKTSFFFKQSVPLPHL